jgi:hypothetical protein
VLAWSKGNRLARARKIPQAQRLKRGIFKYLISPLKMVPGGGIEPPTLRFSVTISTFS